MAYASAKFRRHFQRLSEAGFGTGVIAGLHASGSPVEKRLGFGAFVCNHGNVARTGIFLILKQKGMFHNKNGAHGYARRFIGLEKLHIVEQGQFRYLCERLLRRLQDQFLLR